MYFRHLLAATLLLTTSATHAQDKLTLRNGTTLDVKVTEVGVREILYKRFDNINGPTYRVQRTNVEGIQYENGTTEDLARNGSQREGRPALNYGRSTLSLAPIQFTDVTVRGLGIYYERAVGERGIVALRLPVVLNFPTQNNNRGYEGLFTTLYPGVNFYPKGFDGPVRYALGPSLALGVGRRRFTDFRYLPGGQMEYVNVEDDVFYYGIMVNNSLNINAGEHLYMGLEFGLGMKYSNTQQSQPYSSYYYYESPVLTNFNFRIGYRF